ncbi:aldehyde dehydrogenase family protein [Acidomonas methanolica]|uniref:Aldehyde dehydrogenase n=1 Tax=Acidomonas methanolica NBRC 104435 TaxID=1231351 RepID=A0A023D1F1_ACIMT|nr:aldehyde dehydrogenase family protein [Acidomonas methanolica]MBU2654131.1 aldehyde dehydrogenase family protein [Acidomonas methanolica]TCS30641.1 aldehyde dehydrogenase (NAD+) [Acidomonas methanolica]GAJ27595.1 aldehyde dehydrogenase [Acidomonas methanolica NBRC 104435]GBQ52013.1 NAD-dependent aldehyde dehydrogenase [Acidomonas methanolica]GEK98799.1 aldehyde dehydrogenase [Acidomonas methanolica NBRC 104435]
MSASSSFDPAAIPLPGGHFIGGELLRGTEAIDVHAPSDGAVRGRIPAGDADLVDRAVRNAAHAQRTSGWATCPPRDRARVIRRWADLVETHREELARIESVCSTRPIAETMSWDVPFTAEGLRFFAEYADKLGGEVAATQSDLLGMTIGEPYGVVGAIAPWNFPLVMGSWKVAPALVAGNAVVLKPSEMTPFSMACLARLGIEAGLPAGLFNVVQGTGAVAGEALSRHPLCGKLTFTGSTRTGIAVMTAAAESGPKPVTLELGGKSPQIVHDDIRSVDEVAERVFRAFTGNAGQVCVAGSRLIVHRRVADALVERLLVLAGTVVPGPTWSGDARYAPIISAPQAARIEAIVARSLASGAVAAAPLTRLDVAGDGCFLAPSVLTNVTPQTAAVQEEIFGPVLTVQTFEDEDEALSLAAHPAYGLAAGVHTADLGRAMRAVRALKAGTVWVNRYGRSADFVIPTGGFGGSGIGKDLGRQAVEANLRHKSVLMAFGG